MIQPKLGSFASLVVKDVFLWVTSTKDFEKKKKE